jgi:hypothetical protein
MSQHYMFHVLYDLPTVICEHQLTSYFKIHFCCSVAGDVKFFDLRRNSSVETCETSQGMTAMAVHKAADTFAWYVEIVL